MKMHILQRVISMLLVLCMVTLPLCTHTVYATGEDAQETTPVSNEETTETTESTDTTEATEPTDEEQGNLRAILYNAGDKENATESVKLTAKDNASVMENISRTGNNLLEIYWTYPANQVNTLKITVPTGLYIVENSWTIPDKNTGSLMNTPTFAPWDAVADDDNDASTAGLQQETGILSNAQTGTLTYTTEAVEGVQSKTEYITLFVAVDAQLWDKGQSTDDGINNGALTAAAIDGNANAIEIIDSNGETRVLSDVFTQDSVPARFEGRSAKDNSSKLIADSEDAQTPVQFVVFDKDYTKYEWAYKQISATYKVTYIDKTTNEETAITITGVDVPTDKKLNATSSYTAGYQNPTLVSNEGGSVTYTIEDFYVGSVEMMIIGEPQFVVNGLNLDNNGKITVSAEVTLVSYNGSTRTVTGLKETLTYKTENKYSIAFYNSLEDNNTQYAARKAWYGEAEDVIDVLGVLTFRNAGIGAIPAGATIQVVFDTDYYKAISEIQAGNTLPAPSMLVSSFRLIALGNKNPETIAVTVDYIYQDDNSEWQAAQKTIAVNNSQAGIENGALLTLGYGKYLTKVEYTMPEIPGDVYFYRSGSPYRDTSGGVYHGRMLTEVEETTITSKMTLTIPVTDIDNKVSNDVHEHTWTTGLQALNQTEYIAYLEPIDSISAKAGEDASMDLTLSAYDYGYTASSYVPHPTIFAVLPKGISVTGASYAHATNAEKTIDGVNITCWDHTDGKNVVYKIDLGTDAAFGGFRLPSSTGSALVFHKNRYCYVNLQLHLSASLRASSYNIRDLLTLTTEIPTTETYSTYGQESGSGATLARSAKTYTYGVSSDDKTESWAFSSFENNQTMALLIVPRTNGITFVPEVSEKGVDGWRNGTSQTAAITVAPGDQYYYRITAKNASDEGVPQANTALYIPVAHKGNVLPEAMGGATVGKTFGVRLTGPVTVAGDTAAAWELRYAFEITATENDRYYSNAAADFTGDGTTYAEWYTAETIENDADLYWENVLCIKAVVSESYINANGENAYPKDAEDTFTLALTMTPGKVGESLNYASATWNLYDAAGTTPEGGVLFNTAFVKVIRGQRIETREVSINAEPNTGANNTQLALENFAGVAFKITNVVLSDVALQTADTISTNRKNEDTMPDRIVQDATFGITMTLNSNALADLASVNAGDTLGSSEVYADNTLQFGLYCYRHFLEAATPRYVDVTVSDSDSSVVITYRVNILRTLGELEPATGIAAGFYPNGGFGNTTSATAAYDGVVTLQFVCTFDNDYKYTTEESTKESTKDYFIFVLDRYAEDNKRERILAGTPMTLIDMTDPEAPQYYYYKYDPSALDANRKWAIPATYFKHMVTGDNYEQPSPTGQTINFVLMINFKDHKAYDYPSQDHDVNNNGIYGFGIKEGGTGGYYPTDPLMLTTERMHAASMTIDSDYTMTDGQMQLDATLRSYAYSGSIKYQMEDSDANHLWMGRSENIKVKLRQHSLNADGSYKTNDQGAYVYTDFLFPAGSYLTDGVNIYPACPGGGYIKVPISNVSTMQNGTTSLSLTLHVPLVSQLLVDGNDISLYAGYMLAAPYQNTGTPCGFTGKGHDGNAFEKVFTTDDALRVDGDGHLLTAADRNVTFTVHRTDNATDLTWKAYFKDKGVYNTTTPYKEGTAQIVDGKFSIDTSSNNEDSWTPGTYMLEFSTASGAKSYYSLIVLDESS